MEKLPAAVGVFALLLGEEKGHQSEQTSITRFPVSDFTKDEDADNDCQEVDQGKSFWRYSNNGKEGIFNPPVPFRLRFELLLFALLPILGHIWTLFGSMGTLSHLHLHPHKNLVYFG